MNDRPIPPTLHDAMIVATVHCRGCGYDLRGLRVDGKCPECGLLIWETIAGTVDPAASTLPRLSNPRAVGNGLVLLFAALLLGTVTASMILAARYFHLAPRPMALMRFPQDLYLAAAMSGGLGLVAAWMIKPRRTEPLGGEVWTDVWVLAASLAGWTLLSWAAWQRFGGIALGAALPRGERVVWVVLHLALALTALLALRAVRGILGTVGRRSRAYRRARGGRQGIQPMLYALMGAAVGCAVWTMGWGGEVVTLMAGTVAGVCMLMLLIGMVYLLINAWWIRSALVKPPPRIDELLRPAATAG